MTITTDQSINFMDCKYYQETFQTSAIIPSPLTGEGKGGGGQDEDLLVPPPLHPLPPRGGEIFGRHFRES